MRRNLRKQVSNTPQWSSLRRVDWRFLLPVKDGMIRDMVLLGAPAGLAEQLQEESVAQQVHTAFPVEKPVDVIAILQDAQVNLDRVIQCLAPGGALYMELNRSNQLLNKATPLHIQRRLANLGLKNIRTYLAAPDFNHCRRYIPLDVPEALEWYMSTLYQAGTPFQRLIEMTVHLSIKRSELFAALLPGYALIATKGPRDPAASSVLSVADLPAVSQNSDLTPALLTSGQDNGSRAILLPFALGCSQPIAVLKISTLPRFNHTTEREQTILAGMSDRLDRDLRETIPKPLGLFSYGSLSVGMESYTAGKSIQVLSGRWRVSVKDQVADLNLAIQWLAQYHRQSHFGRTIWDDSVIQQWIDAPIEAYISTFGKTKGMSQLFEQVRRRARQLAGKTLPLVALHFDFGPWNLYRSGQTCKVIDWEFGRDWERDQVGPSPYDLLYFVTYWIYLVQHLDSPKAELEGFYGLFIQPNCANPHVKAAHEVISHYLEDFQIDACFLPLMVVYLWVEQALYQFSRKRTLGSRSGLQVQNQSIRYLDLIANHQKQFFMNLEGDGCKDVRKTSKI